MRVVTFPLTRELNPTSQFLRRKFVQCNWLTRLSESGLASQFYDKNCDPGRQSQEMTYKAQSRLRWKNYRSFQSGCPA